MARVKAAKELFVLNVTYICSVKNTIFAVTLDGPQGYLGHWWVVIW